MKGTYLYEIYSFWKGCFVIPKCVHHCGYCNQKIFSKRKSGEVIEKAEELN
jgi:hypothetical protein